MCGVLTQVGQVCLTKSLQSERIAKVAVLNYIGLIYALIFGVTMFGEHYTAQTVFGISLVVTGVLFAVVYGKTRPPESLRRRKRQSSNRISRGFQFQVFSFSFVVRNGGDRNRGGLTHQQKRLGNRTAGVILDCMRRHLSVLTTLLVALSSIHAAETIASHDAKIGHVRLHYLTAGHGPAVILLHGFAETSQCGGRSSHFWPRSSRSSRRICRVSAIPRSRIKSIWSRRRGKSTISRFR